jgi:hypothetical protein
VSAFRVSDTHISVLVLARHVARTPLRVIADRLSDDELGRMLLRENLRSLAARYADPVDEEEIARFVAAPACLMRPLSPVEMIKAVHCYVYQSCEHAEWEASDAMRYCDALVSHLTHVLPGYDAAPWGFEPSDVARPGANANVRVRP